MAKKKARISLVIAAVACLAWSVVASAEAPAPIPESLRPSVPAAVPSAAASDLESCGLPERVERPLSYAYAFPFAAVADRGWLGGEGAPDARNPRGPVIGFGTSTTRVDTLEMRYEPPPAMPIMKPASADQEVSTSGTLKFDLFEERTTRAWSVLGPTPIRMEGVVK